MSHFLAQEIKTCMYL